MTPGTVVAMSRHLGVRSRTSRQWLALGTRRFGTSQQHLEPPRTRPLFQDPRPRSMKPAVNEAPAEPSLSVPASPVATRGTSETLSQTAESEPAAASTQIPETTSPLPASRETQKEAPTASDQTSTIATPPASSQNISAPPPSPSSAPQTQPSLLSSVMTNRNDVMSNALSSIASGLQSKSPVQTLPTYGLQPQSLASKHGISNSGPIRPGDDEHHLHVYSHRHNTHLTLADTERNSIISISAGNLGFKKSQRGTYDAAYQLTAYLLSRMQQQGLMTKVKKLELCLRGFGQGREAVLKVITGLEGNRLRDKIVRIVDKTRLKIGGNRSPSPRRLG